MAAAGNSTFASFIHTLPHKQVSSSFRWTRSLGFRAGATSSKLFTSLVSAKVVTVKNNCSKSSFTVLRKGQNSLGRGGKCSNLPETHTMETGQLSAPTGQGNCKPQQGTANPTGQVQITPYATMSALGLALSSVGTGSANPFGAAPLAGASSSTTFLVGRMLRGGAG